MLDAALPVGHNKAASKRNKEFKDENQSQRAG
jgi:hypothetical protein